MSEKKCDICKSREAVYDAKTSMGPWAYVCDECFKRYCVQVKGVYFKLNKESKK